MAKKKNKKKKNKGLGLLFGLIVIAIIVFVGIGVFKGYKNSKVVLSDLETLNNKITEKYKSINTLSSDLELISSDNKNLKVSYKSSNEKFLSNSGVVTQPLDYQGDVTVGFSVTVEVINLGFFDNFVFKFISKENSVTYNYTFTILSRALTNQEKIDLYLNELYMPSSICNSMDLPSEILDSSCTWNSSNTNVLDNSGKIISSGEVTLKLTLSIGEDKKDKEYNIKVSNELIPNNDSYDFSSFNKSSYSGEASYGDLSINNAISNNESVKFKVEGENAYIKTLDKTGVYKISFDYKVIDDKGFTKENSVKLLFINENSEIIELKKELISDNELHTFVYEDSNLLDGSFKILFSTEYTERNISLDNLTIYKNFGINEAKEELLKLIPKNVSKNVILPFTTPFGGKVSYETDNDALTNLGYVTKQEEAVDVNVTIKISFLDEEKNETKVIKVSGVNSKTKVEIRFIDLSHFGGYNDCGESTYIKYDNYDILIDGGDDYQTTVESVEYVLNTYCEDKTLDLVIATHPDSDHIGGMDSIINDYDVLRVLEFNGTAQSKVYENYAKSVSDENAEVCKVNDAVHNLNGCEKIINISNDGEVYIEIIDTTFYESTDNNTRSVVCVLHAYSTKVLFTGDADNNKVDLEKAYMNSVGDIDILKVVHHGTSNGTTLDFLQAVDPEVAIICNGNYLGNKHGHPTYEAISRLYQYDSNMLVYAITGGDSEDCKLESSYKCNPTDYTVDRNGTITIIIDNNGYSISSEYYFDNPIEIKDTSFYKSRLALGN